MDKNATYAVIDLGTNTFHLLIAEVTADGRFRDVFREQHFVKLAADGIERIGPEPFARGLAVMQQFKEILDAYPIVQLKAMGTAALRTASNGQAFLQQVAATTGIHIELIDGNQEAAFILRGVRQAVPMGTERMLIMDIGGGSVEFIIANADTVFWAQSFPVGVAVLHRLFHRHDPISAADISALFAYLKEQLAPLHAALERYPTDQLIGASGTFDVLEAFLATGKIGPYHTHLKPAVIKPFHEKIIRATLEERLTMPGMPTTRADLIVVALLLIEFIITLAPIHDVHISAFAMKEGILETMLAENK